MIERPLTGWQRALVSTRLAALILHARGHQYGQDLDSIVGQYEEQQVALNDKPRCPQVIYATTSGALFK